MATQTVPDAPPPPPPSPPAQLTKLAPAYRVPRLQEAGLIIVIFILGGILSAYGWMDAAPGRANTFLNPDNLIDGVATPMSWYAIMAVGMTFVVITGGIDISVGSIFALSALGAAAVLQNMPREAPAWQAIPVAFVIAAGIGVLCGLINGSLIVGLRMHPFIVTLGTMSIFRGIANVATPQKTLPIGGRSLPESFTSGFMRMEIADLGGLRPMPLIVMLVFVLIGWFYLSALVAGRETYAIGGNEEAARFSGLRIGRIKLRVYALMGLAAGVAGWVSLGWFGTASTTTGLGYELSVIAAAVVGGASLSGGRGSALGALLGALVIQLIGNGIYILHWNEEYRAIIIGLAIIVAVAVDRLSEYWRARRMTRVHG